MDDRRTTKRRRKAAARFALAILALSLAAAATPAAAQDAKADCARIEEGEIRVAVLILLDAAGSAWVRVTDLVERLGGLMKPCGEDLLPTANGSTRFEAKLRVLSNRTGLRTSLIEQGLAEYVGQPEAAWRILPNGAAEVAHWRRWIDLEPQP